MFESRVVNVFVCPSHVSVRPCQLDRPLVRPTSIRLQEGKLGVTPTYVADTSHSKWAPPKHEHAPKLTRR